MLLQIHSEIGVSWICAFLHYAYTIIYTAVWIRVHPQPEWFGLKNFCWNESSNVQFWLGYVSSSILPHKHSDEHGTFNFVKKKAAARCTDKYHGLLYSPSIIVLVRTRKCLLRQQSVETIAACHWFICEEEKSHCWWVWRHQYRGIPLPVTRVSGLVMELSEQRKELRELQ